MDNSKMKTGGRFALLAMGWLLVSCQSANSSHSTNSENGIVNSSPQILTAGAGVNYYVSATGKDSNNGTSPTTAFGTIGKAAGLTNPGDTVNIMNGTYTNPCSGCDVLDVTRSGSASGGYITYQAYPGQTPLIQFTNSWSAINIQASYIVVSGLQIYGLDQASLTAAEAASLGESSPKSNSAGIVVGSTSLSTPWTHIIIKNNVVHGCSEGGIGVMRSDYITIQGNTTYDNANWSPYGGSGISLGFLANSDTVTGYKNFVIGNISYNNQMLVGEPAAGGTMADGNGIIIDDNENDQVSSAAYTGRTLVENNLAYMNGGTGMHTFHSQHVDFFYNTAYMNNQSANNSNGQIAGILVNDVNISNNILYGTGTKPLSSSSGNTNFTLSYNIFYNGQVPTAGTNNITANPNFVTPGSNFQLLSSSPAIDSATSLYTVATDLLGNLRPKGAGYDRGAYEYQAGGSPAPTPAPQTIATPKPTPLPTPVTTPVPTPIPTPNGTLTFSFNSGSVSLTSASIGQTVTFTDAVTSSIASSNIIIFTQLQNSAGTVVSSGNFSGQSFSAGQTKSFNTTYTIPVTLPTGPYYHTVEVFDSTWATNYLSHFDASTLTVVSAPKATPVPTPAPTPAQTLSFTFSSGSVSQASANPGQTVTFTDAVKSGASVSNVIIFTQLQNSTGQVVATSNVSGQTFAASQTRSFTTSFTIPTSLPAGTYYHTVEVFNSSWSTNYLSHYDSSTLTIK